MRPDAMDPDNPEAFADAFSEAYPELAPLAPVADALRFVNGGPPERIEVDWDAIHRAKLPFGPTPDPDAVFQAELDADAAARADLYWTSAIEHLDGYGFIVHPKTRRVTLENRRAGPNPSVRTIAAGLVLDSMGLEKTDPVTNEVGERVASRLRDALHYRRLNGRDESFKKTLRKHLLHSHRYRLAVQLR